MSKVKIGSRCGGNCARLEAVARQQATWALPARGDFVEAAARVVALVELAGGDAFAFNAGHRLGGRATG
jgi:hypothetical protein